MNVDRDWLLVATDPDPDRDRKASDDELARELLADKLSASGGVASYIESGSPQEGEACAALARRIRDQTPRGFTLELLALAIDPDTKSTFVGMVPTRKIKFENPKTGHAPQWRRDLKIADFIRKQLPKEAKKKRDDGVKAVARARKVGKKGRELTKIIKRAEILEARILEAAYDAACKEYGVSRTRVQEIWTRHRKAISARH